MAVARWILTREHELGLSAVLKARIEAIRDATRRVEEGVTKEEMDSLREGTVQLAELLRQISRQLDQDRHAILINFSQCSQSFYNMSRYFWYMRPASLIDSVHSVAGMHEVGWVRQTLSRWKSGA